MQNHSYIRAAKKSSCTKMYKSSVKKHCHDKKAAVMTNSVEMYALIDTGSECNMINKKSKAVGINNNRTTRNVC